MKSLQRYRHYGHKSTMVKLFGCIVIVGILAFSPERWGFGDASLARQTAAAYAGWLAARRDDHEVLAKKDLKIFEEVALHILSNYVEDIPAESLLSAAKQKTVEAYSDPTQVSDWDLVETGIAGMLTTLDDYSSFLDADANRLFDENLNGEFGGLGIEIAKGETGIDVRRVLGNSPAGKAGMLEGDVIVEAEGTDLREASVRDAVLILRGKPGSYVSLQVERPKDPKNILLRIQREIIKNQAVEGGWMQDYIVIKISDFHYNVNAEMSKVLATLQQQKSPRGYILDLRGNRGGSFLQSIQVSDYFLDFGTIVFTEDRQKKRYYANGKTPDMSGYLPMVVLIDGESASASEIVAGAMRDRDRAILIGNTSYGKGSVQNKYALSRGMALKLTTQYYFTPLGHSVNEGIVPDVEIDDNPDQEGDEQLNAALGVLERLASYQDNKKPA